MGHSNYASFSNGIGAMTLLHSGGVHDFWITTTMAEGPIDRTGSRSGYDREDISTASLSRTYVAGAQYRKKFVDVSSVSGDIFHEPLSREAWLSAISTMMDASMLWLGRMAVQCIFCTMNRRR